MHKNQLHELKLGSFVAIDVETTGLNYKKDKIIEIAAVKFINGKESTTYSKLIDPKMSIPPFITKITGISNSMINKSSVFPDIADEFLEFIGNDPIVGHNVSFDIDFINEELKLHGSRINQEYVCDTYYLAKIFFFYFNSFKLESISSKFNIDISNAHRALDDALATGILFIKLLNEIYKTDMESLFMLSKASYKLNSKLFTQAVKLKTKSPKSNYLNKNYFKLKANNNKNIFNNINDVLGEKGIIAKKNSKYEYRKSQISFSECCLKTIQNNDLLVAEAGTGLGKSLGYLVPALMNVEKNNIIISTSTHALQSQLIEQDIPIASKSLNKEINSIIIKGKNNYLCFDRLINVLYNIDDFLVDEEEYYEFQSLLVWANKTLSGDIGECEGFNIKRNKSIWNLVKYNNENCYLHSNKEKVSCFYNNILKMSKKSNIFIVNHALLVRNIDNQDLLFRKPTICIVDEAHKLADNFRDSMTTSFSYLDFQKEYERVVLLINNILETADSFDGIVEKYRKFRKKMTNLINLFKEFSFSYAESKINRKSIGRGQTVFDIRYLVSDDQNFFISLSIDQITNLIKEVQILFKNIETSIDLFNISKIKKTEMTNISNRLNDFEKLIDNNFIKDKKNNVLWMKVYCSSNGPKLCIFNSTPLSVDSMMKKFINSSESLIFCSASLSINGDFSYFLKESSLNNIFTEKNIEVKNFESPFFYNDQIKLFYYNCNEDINSEGYVQKISKLIIDIKNKVNKRMLILCTSFNQIESFKAIFDKNDINKFLYQKSSSSKESLLKQYKLNNESVLFGTNSFWEGIDLPKDLLEILIILKVPFSNPQNPVISAKINSYNQDGENPFYQYQLPQAILKLNQGFGRLIRSQDDSGVCIITDPRLTIKSYGKIIMDSLPTDGVITSENSLIVNKTETFLNI